MTYEVLIFLLLAKGDVSQLGKDNQADTGNQSSQRTKDPPVDNLPVDDLPVDDLPVDDLPVDDLPVDDLPVDDLPADKTLANDTLANDTLANDTLDDEDIFEGFDVDAPLDENIDIDVKWPDKKTPPTVEQDSINEQVVQLKDDVPTGDDPSGAAQDDPNVGIFENPPNDIERQEALQFEDNEDVAGLEDTAEEQSLRLDSTGQQNYRIIFSGLQGFESGRVINRFDALSSLKTEANQIGNGSQILKRAKTDIILIEQLLRLEGFYDNLVEYNITANPPTRTPNDINNIDVNVTFDILLGPQYRFGTIDFPGLERNEDFAFLRGALDFVDGSPVQQDMIVNGRARLQERLLETGYVFGIVGEADLLIDHARREGDLTLPVSLGRKYQFGRIITEPDAVLSGAHLEDIARFKTGDIFQQSNVVDLRQAIFATSLASNIVITPVVSSADKDKVDLNVELDPAPLRTISGQVGFNTGEGFRLETSWEHRNFFPPEGAISIAGILGTREQAAGITFRRNNFTGRDRVLSANFAARNQNLDAFDARSLDIGVGYERKTTLVFQKKWTWNIGIEYSLSDERAIFNNVQSRELFNILAFPAGVTYDGSDDLLDPKKGFRLSARIAPEVSTGIDNIAYFKSQIDGSVYQPVNDRLVVAGRVRLGSITGADTSSIAPSRRNFAGGGSSVRGFGFQDIGPLDISGNTTGGRGLAEFAIEARYRIGAFGIVPFFDAGSVSNKSTPDFSDLRYAAGVGLRYYTSFGPVRIDVGTPLDRRSGENIIAVAISLGQAF